jgi:hypothetical protein
MLCGRRENPGLLTQKDDVDKLLSLLKAQDHNGKFHEVVMDMMEDPEQEIARQVW